MYPVYRNTRLNDVVFRVKRFKTSHDVRCIYLTSSFALLLISRIKALNLLFNPAGTSLHLLHTIKPFQSAQGAKSDGSTPLRSCEEFSTRQSVRVSHANEIRLSLTDGLISSKKRVLIARSRSRSKPEFSRSPAVCIHLSFLVCIPSPHRRSTTRQSDHGLSCHDKHGRASQGSVCETICSRHDRPALAPSLATCTEKAA